MDALRNINKQNQALCSLVALALLVQLLFPLNFHMHHNADNSSQGHHHSIDFHAMNDGVANEHLADQDAVEININQDIFTKKDGDRGTGFLFLTFILMLLPVIVHIINRWRLAGKTFFARYIYYSLSPPLRAPPVH